MSFNTVVFGLTMENSAHIARAMRSCGKFGNVYWIGLFADATRNTHDLYRFQNDYDSRVKLPGGLLKLLQDVRDAFFLSQARRDTTPTARGPVPRSEGSVYSYVDYLHRYVYLFWELLTKNPVGLVVVDAIPHTSADIILYHVARYLGIRTVCLYQVPVAYDKFMYFTELDGASVNFDIYYDDTLRPKNTDRVDYRCPEEPKSPFYMDTPKSTVYSRQRLFSDLKQLLRAGLPPNPFRRKLHRLAFKIRSMLGSQVTPDFDELSDDRTLESSICSAELTLKYLRQERFRRNVARMIEEAPRLDVPYVYFPLAFQPELSTECLGGAFVSQTLAVETVRRLIPSDWRVYVKEHMLQYELCRDPTFFQRLSSLPNVSFVPTHYDTFELTRHSQFVATIAGTVGWEAINMGKNALVFGDIYYQRLPGVFKYHDELAVEHLLDYQIDRTELERAVSQLISRTENGVVEGCYGDAVPGFNAQDNAQRVVKFLEQFVPSGAGFAAA